jgi:anthranilate synthase component 2
MILLLDNFDSFTYNLVDYLGRLGRETDVKRNNIPESEIDFDSYSALVISPGPEIPSSSGNLMSVLHRAVDKMPVIGICLGHQAIGEYFGGSVIRAQQPMHGKQTLIQVSDNDILFRNLPKKFSVVRYNSLVVSDLGPELLVTAETPDKEIMAIRHCKKPVHGVQFHPEAILTEYGLEILSNWLDYYAIDI